MPDGVTATISATAGDVNSVNVSGTGTLRVFSADTGIDLTTPTLSNTGNVNIARGEVEVSAQTVSSGDLAVTSTIGENASGQTVAFVGELNLTGDFTNTGVFRAAEGGQIELATPVIDNQFEIRVENVVTDIRASTIRTSGPLTELTGGGTLILDNETGSTRTPSFVGSVLTAEQGVIDETFRNVDNTITGTGNIGAGFVLENTAGGLVEARDDWIVHGPPATTEVFNGYGAFEPSEDLHLHEEIRFHLAKDIDRFVGGLLGEDPAAPLASLAVSLEANHYHLRLTRDLGTAKDYLWSRYGDDPEARFGLVASSRDRDLARFGIGNDWNSTKLVRHGPWFVEGDGDELGRSCRALRDCVTEFGCQGLELDAVLLAWGTDFVRNRGEWTNERARRYQSSGRIRDAYQLRVNAYRVLLTRARDACVVYVPPIPLLDETFEFLGQAGFRLLDP